MAHFKITANADIDLLTKEEVAEVLSGWMAEIARGVRFRNFSGQTVLAGGVYTIGLSGQDPIGPREGFLWSVVRISVSGAGVAAAGTDLYSVFDSEVSPSKLVASGLTRGKEWNTGGFVLDGGSQLVVSGVGTGTAGAPVVVAGQAIEIPVQLAWRLL
jgi:hypothetical protein